jgi:hypothetical protein
MIRRPAESDDGARQPANRDDPATWRGFHASWLGSVVAERLVWAARCCSRRCSSVGADGAEPRSSVEPYGSARLTEISRCRGHHACSQFHRQQIQDERNALTT